jgi:hypothetical protein
LVAATLEERFVVEPPERLIGDKAYDSDGLDQVPLEDGMELIAPTAPIVGNRTRTDGSCGATGGAGKSSACSPGCITSAAW